MLLASNKRVLLQKYKCPTLQFNHITVFSQSGWVEQWPCHKNEDKESCWTCCTCLSTFLYSSLRMSGDQFVFLIGAFHSTKNFEQKNQLRNRMERKYVRKQFRTFRYVYREVVLNFYSGTTGISRWFIPRRRCLHFGAILVEFIGFERKMMFSSPNEIIETFN